jgi:hypothetical protein
MRATARSYVSGALNHIAGIRFGRVVGLWISQRRLPLTHQQRRPATKQ